jgi:uncharacterized protein YodC (DUF2158 family)
MKIGDIVQLKSGGPIMTITDIDDPSGRAAAYCVWFSQDAGGRFYEYNDQVKFPMAALRPFTVEN